MKYLLNGVGIQVEVNLLNVFFKFKVLISAYNYERRHWWKPKYPKPVPLFYHPPPPPPPSFVESPEPPSSWDYSWMKPIDFPPEAPTTNPFSEPSSNWDPDWDPNWNYWSGPSFTPIPYRPPTSTQEPNPYWNDYETYVEMDAAVVNLLDIFKSNEIIPNDISSDTETTLITLNVIETTTPFGSSSSAPDMMQPIQSNESPASNSFPSTIDEKTVRIFKYNGK